ncbi:MAG: YwqG family protein [Hellea sp.]
MTKDRQKLTRYIILACSLLVGILIYAVFSQFTWKMALIFGAGFAGLSYFMLTLIMNYYFEVEAAKKRQFKRKVDLQSQILGALSDQVNRQGSNSSQLAETRKIVPELNQPIEQAAQALARPALGFHALQTTVQISDSKTSWLGGLPKLAPGFQWPIGTDRNNKNEAFMHFLAQIDCSSLPHEPSMGLPQEGSLSFFVDFESVPQHCAVIYQMSSANAEHIQPPAGLRPIFPRKKIDALPQTFIRPVIFNALPSFDHLFGTTHSNPYYKIPEWEEEELEDAALRLETQHRQAFDHALQSAGIDLPPEFKQLEPKVTVQSGGWARGSQGDLPSNDNDVVLLSLSYDEQTSIVYGDMGDINFVMTKEDLKTRNFSNVRVIING